MKKLILIFTLILLFGCKVKQSSVQTIKTTDTVIVTEVLRDTIISIIPYKAQIDGLWVNIDTNGLATLDPIEVHSNGIKINSRIDRGKLSISATTDSLKVPVYIKDKTIDKSHSVDKQTVTVKTETYIPAIYKWSFYILLLIIIINIIRATIWIYKRVAI
jgi:hypothetical protein